MDQNALSSLAKKGARGKYLSICSHLSGVSSGGLDWAGRYCQAAGQKLHENRHNNSTAAARLVLVSWQSSVKILQLLVTHATNHFSTCIGAFNPAVLDQVGIGEQDAMWSSRYTCIPPPVFGIENFFLWSQAVAVTVLIRA